jgi:hypothetical protein
VIKADETPLKVIRKDKNQCYMWVYSTGTDSPPDNKSQSDPPNIVIFDYKNSRRQRLLARLPGLLAGRWLCRLQENRRSVIGFFWPCAPKIYKSTEKQRIRQTEAKPQLDMFKT